MPGKILNRDFLQAIINPQSICPICGATKSQLLNTGICAGCTETLIRPSAPYCERCHKVLATDSYAVGMDAYGNLICADCERYRTRHFSRNRSAFLYNEPARELIELYKYFGKESLAKPLAKLLAETYREYYEQLNIDLISSIPLHESRLRERSFNQAKLLAVELSRFTGIPYADVLVKKKATAKLSQGTRSERFRQLEHSFEFVGACISGLRILLIDDIYTTGATAEQASSKLVSAGAAEVLLLTLARAYEK
jgi:ComF family protein